MRKALLAALCGAALLPWAWADEPKRPNQDEAEITKLAKLYERAINEDNVELLVPLVESGTDIMAVTGTRISNVAELRALWARLQQAKKKGGDQGKHTTKVTIDSLQVNGTQAIVRGHADETFVTGDGKVLQYQLPFDSQGAKVDGKWRLTSMQTRANLLDKVTLAARVLAIELWHPRVQLKDPKAAPPDWDQDRGANDKDAAAAMPAAGAPKAALPPAAAAAPAAKPVRRPPPPPPPMTRTAR
ncbi:MAG: hypothetical protein HY925_07290 [Elusimicrobia bacterium]|nr:hypothetical protein [Elusimicrobiota bacterium]